MKLYPKRVLEVNATYPNINAERARMGLTLDQFADILGVTRKTVYNWIAKGNIPQSKPEQMSEMFHCSIDYLLNYKPAPKGGTNHERTDPNG